MYSQRRGPRGELPRRDRLREGEEKEEEKHVLAWNLLAAAVSQSVSSGGTERKWNTLGGERERERERQREGDLLWPAAVAGLVAAAIMSL